MNPLPALRRRVTGVAPDGTLPARWPLSTTAVAANLQIARGTVWANHRLGEVPWWFRDYDHRAGVVRQIAAAASDLIGRDFHLRVTHGPWSGAEWARRTEADTVNPLPAVPGAPSFDQRLLDAQAEIARYRRRVVHLGVTVGTGSKVTDTHVEQADRVGRLLADPAFAGTPATPTGLVEILHRSVAPFAPAPDVPPFEAPEGDPWGDWTNGYLAAVKDPVQWDAADFGDTVRVTARRGGEVRQWWVAVLVLANLEDRDTVDGEPWLHALERAVPFPVEVSMRGTFTDWEEASQQAVLWQRRAADLRSEYRKHDEDVPPHVDTAVRTAGRIIADTNEGTPDVASRVYTQTLFAVGAESEGLCLRYRSDLIAAARRRHIWLETPGNQVGHLRSFTPGEPEATSKGYRITMPVRLWASAVPHVKTRIGHDHGYYIGHTTMNPPQPVFFAPHDTIENNRGAALYFDVAKPNYGKSTFELLIAYWATLAGECVRIWDPSGPMARLTTLPELAPWSLHIDLAGGTPGLLSPFWLVVDDPEALAESRVHRREVAKDTTRLLLPPSVRNTQEAERALGEVFRRIPAETTTSMWEVLDMLRHTGHNEIAGYLEDVIGTTAGRLIFGDRGQRPGVHDFGRYRLVVFTMAGLPLPKLDTDESKWSITERLAVPVLNLGMLATARDLYTRPTKERKTFIVDEGNQSLESHTVRTLSNRVATDGRKVHIHTRFSMQDPDGADAVPTGRANKVGVMLGRQDDAPTAQKAWALTTRPAVRETPLTSLGVGQFIAEIEGEAAPVKVERTWLGPAWVKMADTTPNAHETEVSR